VAATSDSVVAERMRLTLDLIDLTERMLRQKLHRKHPAATDDELDRMVGEWRRERPGAEHGDSAGRPIPWPRPA
jgi:hypothetical protein